MGGRQSNKALGGCSVLVRKRHYTQEIVSNFSMFALGPAQISVKFYTEKIWFGQMDLEVPAVSRAALAELLLAR